MDKPNKEQLQRFYDRMTSSPYFKVYTTLLQKVNETCDAFDRVKIDISAESKVFDNFIKFSKEIGKTMADMEKIIQMIDPTRAKEIKERQKQNNSKTLESFVFNTDDD